MGEGLVCSETGSSNCGLRTMRIKPHTSEVSTLNLCVPHSIVRLSMTSQSHLLLSVQCKHWEPLFFPSSVTYLRKGFPHVHQRLKKQMPFSTRWILSICWSEMPKCAPNYIGFCSRINKALNPQRVTLIARCGDSPTETLKERLTRSSFRGPQAGTFLFNMNIKLQRKPALLS